MQPVNILCDEPHAIGPSPLKLHERVVGGIRLFRGNQFTPPVVPFPDQPRVPRKGFWRGEVFSAKGTPQAIRPAKGRYAAIRRNAGSREDGHVPSGREVCVGEEDVIVGSHGQMGEVYRISSRRICVV